MSDYDYKYNNVYDNYHFHNYDLPHEEDPDPAVVPLIPSDFNALAGLPGLEPDGSFDPELDFIGVRPVRLDALTPAENNNKPAKPEPPLGGLVPTGMSP